MDRMAYAVGALAGLWLFVSGGPPGRALRHLVLWGAVGAAVYVVLAAAGAPRALRPPLNPYTVGAAAVLGAPGIGVAVLAHALFG
jgi:hypothetical protein